MTPQDYKRSLELRDMYQQSYQMLIAHTEAQLADDELSDRVIIKEAFESARKLNSLIGALNALVNHYESINEGETK